jgi:hypothetical protein
MPKHRYEVGDRVLASRAETGEDHELGEVVDSYELLIGSDERRPIIVVQFEDGERKYMTAATPNVLPVELDEEDLHEGAEAEVTASTNDEDAGADPEMPAPVEPELE